MGKKLNKARCEWNDGRTRVLTARPAEAQRRQQESHTLHDTQTPIQPFFKPTAQGAKDDGGGDEPQLPGLKMNVCPYSGTLVQTGTGASLPPQEENNPPPVGKQRSDRRGADFVGGRSGLQWRQHYVLATITSEHAEGGIQYPKSLSITTPQGTELQQAHFTEKVIKAQSEGMLPYPSSLTSSDSETSAAPDRYPSQGGSFSCLPRARSAIAPVSQSCQHLPGL